MLLRKLVLIEKQRAAAGLAENEIELADVAEIAGDHTSAVAIAVGARQIADVQKIAAALRISDVQKRPLALEGAQVVSLTDNVPRILHPKLSEGFVELARLLNFGASVVWL